MSWEENCRKIIRMSWTCYVLPDFVVEIVVVVGEVVVEVLEFLRIALSELFGLKGLLKSEIFSFLSSSLFSFSVKFGLIFGRGWSCSVGTTFLTVFMVSSSLLICALLLLWSLFLLNLSKAGILMSGNLAMGLKNGGLALLGGFGVVVGNLKWKQNRHWPYLT